MQRVKANDSQWILSAYTVLSNAQTAMHVGDIEEHIRANDPADGPSMPLEVLLTKEAAMGRRFTKPDGSSAGFFSLLPAQASVTERAGSASPSQSLSLNAPASPVEASVSPNLKYHQKYNRLKRTCKQMLYLNAALYDEIARIEQKIESTSKERREILQKIMTDQNIVNHKEPKAESRSHKTSDSEISAEAASTPKQKGKAGGKAMKKKGSSSPPAKRLKMHEDQEASATLGEGSSGSTPTGKSSKKSKSEEQRSLSYIKIPPISLDSAGRPILPIELSAGLTVYSIGEINDKPGYCVTSSIYPVGFCSTREFACIRDPMKKCLYTCKVSEGTGGPQFEISPDTDQGTVFTDSSPEGCHDQLLQLLRGPAELDLLIKPNSDFFGLKHPVVKNLLQCSQGAGNCLEYKWCKFEVIKNSTKAIQVASEADPATNFKALYKRLKKSSAAAQGSAHDSVDPPEKESNAA